MVAKTQKTYCFVRQNKRILYIWGMERVWIYVDMCRGRAYSVVDLKEVSKLAGASAVTVRDHVERWGRWVRGGKAIYRGEHRGSRRGGYRG